MDPKLSYCASRLGLVLPLQIFKQEWETVMEPFWMILVFTSAKLSTEFVDLKLGGSYLKFFMHIESLEISHLIWSGRF